MARIERLNCTVKNYVWGKRGHNSEVARLFSAGHEDEKIGQNIPYAELWIGTHPDGPAIIRSAKTKLSEYIADSGDKQIHLPYIMKIMSIDHTLSLQVHPTKEQAVQLNIKDPLHYPDQNHKPELAYALSRFELLCGFRPPNEIVTNMKAFPELCGTMGIENCKLFMTLNGMYEADNKHLINAMKKCFSAMIMHENKAFIRELLNSVFDKIENGVKGCLSQDALATMKDMFKRFPNDIGCLSPLYLNHIIMQPGECIYYGAQELHAYLKGECVECVSCSNNTIRAGLTNKFIDRENLVEVLNYRMVHPSFYFVPPQRLNAHPYVIEFLPNCTDFTLHCLDIHSEAYKFPIDLPKIECSSVFVLIEAVEATCMELDQNGHVLRYHFAVKRGDIFFIPAMHILRFLSAKGPVKGYRTFSFEDGPDHSKRVMVEDFDDQPQLISPKKCKGLKTATTTTDIADVSIFDIEAEMDGFLC